MNNEVLSAAVELTKQYIESKPNSLPDHYIEVLEGFYNKISGLTTAGNVPAFPDGDDTVDSSGPFPF